MGILTNGIVWLVYVKDDLVRVIDILNNNDNEVWEFFYDISRESFTMNTFRNRPTVSYYDPELNHYIIIEKKNYGRKRGELKVAQKYVIKQAIKKNAKILQEPSPFYRKIGASKGRSSESVSVEGNRYKITGDYGVCDKYASLLEINTALDLGFKISLE